MPGLGKQRNGGKVGGGMAPPEAAQLKSGVLKWPESEQCREHRQRVRVARKMGEQAIGSSVVRFMLRAQDQGRYRTRGWAGGR